jgi:hypothetical protein
MPAIAQAGLPAYNTRGGGKQAMKTNNLQLKSIIGATAIIVAVACALAFAEDLGAERQAANKAKCLNNLKQCSQALKMYADDYDGWMPSSKLVSKSKTWNKADSLMFISITGKLSNDGKTRKQTLAQVLYNNMRSPDILFCPEDPVDKSDPKATVSYWYKLANDKAWYGVGCPAPRRRMGDYAYEADQAVFYERTAFHYGGTGLTNFAQINISFMDTHVEITALRNATSGDPINCAVNGNGEPMYYNHRDDPKTGKSSQQSGPATYTDPTCCFDSF